MNKSSSYLQDISLVTNNFGDATVFAHVLDGWLDVLGGKPGEVVVVDAGSDSGTQDIYWQLFQDRKIDKLQIIQTDHKDNQGSQATGYIQEYTAAAISNKPYILWFHIHTLPKPKEADRWLEEAIAYLERLDTLAISGPFNVLSKHHDAWPGWYFSDQCSLDFLLIKRSILMNAVYDYTGELIISGHKTTDSAARPDQNGSVVEAALEIYSQRQGLYTLCQGEGPNDLINSSPLYQTISQN